MTFHAAITATATVTIQASPRIRVFTLALPLVENCSTAWQVAVVFGAAAEAAEQGAEDGATQAARRSELILAVRFFAEGSQVVLAPYCDILTQALCSLLIFCVIEGQEVEQRPDHRGCDAEEVH